MSEVQHASTTSITYWFPPSSIERVSFVALGISVVAIPIVVAYIFRSLAVASGESLLWVFQAHGQLRWLFGLLCVTTLGTVYTVAAHLMIRRGTYLVIGDGRVRFHRPGLPGTTLLGRDVELVSEEIERMEIDARGRSIGRKAWLRVSGRGDVSFRVPVEDAVTEPGAKPVSRPKPAARDDWTRLPVVASLLEQVGDDVALDVLGAP